MIGLVNLFVGETATFNLAFVEMSIIFLVVWLAELLKQYPEQRPRKAIVPISLVTQRLPRSH